MPTSVAIIEDDPKFMTSLKKLVTQKAKLDIAYTATDFKEGMALLNRPPVDVLFIDLNLPDGHGLEIIKAIKQPSPAYPEVEANPWFNTKIVVWSIFGVVEEMLKAMTSGADGVLYKGDLDRKKLQDIQSILEGEVSISAQISERISKTLIYLAERNELKDNEKLTEAEDAILGLARKGKSNKEIAALRGTSTSTISTQIKSIFRKLGVHSMLAAVSEYYGTP